MGISRTTTSASASLRSFVPARPLGASRVQQRLVRSAGLLLSTDQARTRQTDRLTNKQEMGASSSADHGGQEEEENLAATTGFLPSLRNAFSSLSPPSSSSVPLASFQDLEWVIDIGEPENYQKAVESTGGGLIFLLISGMCIYVILQRRKFIKIKERYFREHGGWILLEEIKAKERYFREQGLAFKIFVEEELEKATEKYDKNRVLGRGGHGTVYKGDSEDSRVVAIKKPKIIDESQKNEFGKELLILSQINHKNIVKLLGCCLEVEVPMLVYEFVSNGTLFQLIHDNNRASPFSLATRLRIAHESAEALAYLHSSASPPIIHGDVKSSNILLDENYTAKVSDFGASKLVPKDEDQFATLVQGTCGYLDPEYLQTCQLTEKSDVYSFSIVLLELMTRKKPVCFEASEDERSLASCFIMATKENRLMEILDDQVRNEGDTELIQEMSELAKQCLKFLGEERPTMKQVTEELDRLRKLKQHPWVPQNTEESESLLSQPLVDHETYCHGIETTTSYNPEKRLALDIEHGR
ncbi:putative wall-associated receptor kinase-like 16 [Musa acuminata AAA Group]|uniref:putative wall-associated receptor kinase-like 16 n=1 Tax=Musa acuminata AAA Group TaxID=214697 RepID=UPI0031E288FD